MSNASLANPALTGLDMQRCIRTSVLRLQRYALEIDQINVFPVPDGDTGHNVLATLKGAAASVPDGSEALGLGEVLARASEGALVLARGNSGMIVAELLRGLAKAAKGIDQWDPEALADGLRLSAREAITAVYEAREGTILTVAAQAANAARGTTVADVLSSAMRGAAEALERTTSQMEALARAGVVDAGGACWLTILEAFYEQVSGELIPHRTLSAPSLAPTERLRYRYDIELLIPSRISVEAQITDPLEAAIAALGDSLIWSDDLDYRKIHIHSDRPAELLARVLEDTPIIHCEISDMQAQADRRLAEQGLRPVVVLPLGMEGWRDPRADFVQPGERLAQDQPGVFWIRPSQALTVAVAARDFGEVYHLLSVYDSSQSWEENRQRIEKMQSLWISSALSTDVVSSPGRSLLDRLRQWAQGRIVTVYLNAEAPAEEDSVWEEALDAAVIRVTLPTDYPVQIVAE